MDEYLPSITVQRGFFTNGFNNKKNYFSLGNNNKGLYQVYKNQNIKTIRNNINNSNNFLIVSNTNKDEINSIKNTTAITFYSRGFSDAKKINNRNIFPETFYNYGNKNSKMKKYDNILINNYNKSKLKENIDNNINNINFRNYNLYLPEVQPEGKLNRTQKGNSLSVSNKENNSNNIGLSNSLFNINIKKIKSIKKDNNSKKTIISHEKIDCQNIHQIKSKDTLTAIGFLDEKKNKFLLKNNKNFSTKKASNICKESQKENKNKNLTTLFKNIKSIKSFTNIKNINLDFNNNLNSMKKGLIQNSKKNKSSNASDTKICPLCHKEKEIYKYRYHLSLHPSKILDWLYLGSYRNACDKQEIKDLGINYVLNCAVECMESFPPGVKYCHLKLSDSPNFRIINYLDKATTFINQAHNNNGIILVHCQLGISRSTTCVIAYFIKYLGYTALSALNFIRQKRTQVMPNFGFLNQLMMYEKKNLNKKKNE